MNTVRSLKRGLTIPRIVLIMMVAAAVLFLISDDAALSQEKTIPPPTDHPGVIKLNISDVTRLTLDNNFQVQWARYDALKGSEDVRAARSIFDTILETEASYENDEHDKATTLSGTQTTRHDQSLSLSKKWATGTTTSISLSHERLFSDAPFNTIASSHEASAQIDVIQSLGRNLFGRIDRNLVTSAQLREEARRWINLDLIEQQVASAQEAYWTYVFQRRRVKIVADMLRQAEVLYQDARQRVQYGLLEQPDLLNIEALVEQRRMELALAENDQATGLALLKVAMGWPQNDPRIIEPEDDLYPMNEEHRDFAEAMSIAVTHRSDYLALKKELEESHIELEIARHARWPEISLAASLARNGVDPDARHAFSEISSQNHATWGVGLVFRLPLENNAAAAQFGLRRLDVTQRLLRLKEKEFTIAVQLEDQLRRMKAWDAVLRHARRTVELQRLKLAAEQQRFEQGRSSTMKLVEYHDDLLNARLKEVEHALRLRLEGVRLNRLLGVLVTESDLQPAHADSSMKQVP